MRCHKCASDNRDENLVCVNCGEALKVFCELCKNYTFANRTHCEFCGFKVEKQKEH